MECALTGMRQLGHPGQAAPGRDSGSTGVQVPCCGEGEQGVFYPRQAQQKRSPPRSTPETAEFLGEDLLQVRAWAGRVGRQACAGCRSRGPGRGCQLGARVESFLKLLAMGSPGDRRKFPAQGETTFLDP